MPVVHRSAAPYLKKTYMRLLIHLAVFSLTALSAAAQQPADSSDLFFRHLSLREVVVTGSTGQTKLKHTSIPISILSQRDLRQLSFTNLIDGIARQPGLSQITTGGGIAKPVIRGLGYNRIIVVNDGIRQEGQQWGDEHGIEIDEHSVQSVQILKGPASLLYGSDALGGVLLFNSAPPAFGEKLYANAATEYQTNNGLFAYTLNAGGSSNSLAWDLRYSDKMAHAYKSPVDGYVPNTQFRQRALNGLLALRQQWGFSRLRLSYFHLTPSIAEGERDPLTGRLLRSYNKATTYGHALPYQQVYHYKAALDNMVYLGGGTLNILAAYQQNRRKEYEEDDDGRAACGLHFLLHTVNYDMRYTRVNANGWKLSAGINGMVQRSSNKGDEYLIPAYRLFDIGLFATAEKTFGCFDLNGGVRYDTRWLHSYALTDEGEQRFTDFARRLHGLTASIGTAYHPSDHLTLKANLSRGFRAPNMSELGSNGVHEGTLRFEEGNHRLRPEYSHQLDLGLDYANRWLSLQVSLFANRIDNYIYLQREHDDATHPSPSPSAAAMPRSRHPHDDDTGLQHYCYTAGDATMMGGEIAADFHPIHSLHLGSTLSYVSARQMHSRRDQRYLPFIPPLRWTTDIKYEISHDQPVWNNAYVAFGMDCYARQDRFMAAYATETATPGYTLFHCSAGIDICRRYERVVSIVLTADNLFNKACQSHLSRLKYAEPNPISGHTGIYNMGRNITCKLVVPVSF